MKVTLVIIFGLSIFSAANAGNGRPEIVNGAVMAPITLTRTGAAPAEPAPAVPPTAPPVSPKDPDIVNCLDKNHKPADQIPPVGNTLVSDPNEAKPTCATGNMQSLMRALSNQLSACSAKSEEEKRQTFQFGKCKVPMQIYCIETNKKLWEMANAHQGSLAEFYQKVRSKFNVYKSDGANNSGKMNFTGYNAPVGSEIKAYENREALPPNDRVAVYAPPENLEHIPDNSPLNCGRERGSGIPIKWCLKEGGAYKALPTSEQIRAGALDGKARVLGYMSKKDYDYLNLEGQGEVAYVPKNGSIQHIKANFAGKNGQQGNLPSSIKKCAAGLGRTLSPDEARRYNESHAFWALGGEDFWGVDNIPLIQNHVIATDPSSIPTGAVSLIQPPGTLDGGCTMMMTASDVGSAIKGARGDLYMGAGPEGKARSSNATGTGAAYMILPKSIPGCN